MAGRRKHRCLSMKVDGAEVRVHGDPKMSPTALAALKRIARAVLKSHKFIAKLQEAREIDTATMQEPMDAPVRWRRMRTKRGGGRR